MFHLRSDYRSLLLHTYLLTYLLTPWSRVLLEKLTGLQLVKKFPAFCGTRMFFAAFTSSRHLSLSWASSIQSIPPHPTSRRFILILFSHLRLGIPNCILRFPRQNSVYVSPLLHTIYMPSPSHSSRFYHPNHIVLDCTLFVLVLLLYYSIFSDLFQTKQICQKCSCHLRILGARSVM
jgi:hypothetical protein